MGILCDNLRRVTVQGCFAKLLNDLCTYPLLRTILLWSSSSVAAEVHMIRPQAGAAAGGVKGVGLELTAIIVHSRGRHVDPAESALSTVVCNWHLSTKIAFD